LTSPRSSKAMLPVTPLCDLGQHRQVDGRVGEPACCIASTIVISAS
jgi:hypothetical protein